MRRDGRPWYPGGNAVLGMQVCPLPQVHRPMGKEMSLINNPKHELIYKSQIHG